MGWRDGFELPQASEEERLKYRSLKLCIGLARTDSLIFAAQIVAQVPKCNSRFSTRDTFSITTSNSPCPLKNLRVYDL